MTIEEFLGEEGKNIEYKSVRPARSKAYMKTVVAFSNGFGGKIIFRHTDNDGNK